ncbi:asparagine synthase (glutamine-hydrolyzing) [Agriterribacter sp.]|uniref:asparagine synthase (glutamine-hydrolyzing) n=1 Tax=Agriterribacter sp. TaxID=2821509 RepID=UPI002CCB3A20|nr:asparagine synthase (glutamine-hydrolyzing) [Agriterribacter sp.]HRP56031.1 asparagine synthase (glutamine-hydrolyzing) [Agriterribacter sp.]
MCGIAGIISPNPASITTHRLKKMADAIAHRGPDGEGYWISRDGTVGFAHRRLSIIDLSESAAQPMHYSSGGLPTAAQRYTITYNGEIYNFPEIKEQLISKGYTFRTSSDTEVILAAYDCFREECLQLFDGMFAFGIWDAEEQTLFTARDRFGEKPFFYYWDEPGGIFLFASEMKALWAAGIKRTVEEEALLYYIGLGFTHFPVEKHRTFYKNIYALPPAHYMKWQVKRGRIAACRYWDIDKDGISSCNEKEAVEKFRSLFFTSVKRRLRSDVPIGTSLSGGLDSSSIAGAIHALCFKDKSYKSFSAVFPGYEKDESKYIREVVSAFALTNFSVSPAHSCLVDSLEKICYHHEQPIGSSSAFAQYAVCQLAGRHGIKVLLDGQGADETIGGYSKYIHWWLQELVSHKKFKQFRKEKKALAGNNIAFEWGYKNYVAACAPGLAALALQKREQRRLAVNSEIEPAFIRAFDNRDGCGKPFVSRLNDILYYNTMQHGLEELLCYADRNSMAHGIELRLPFLSHELVEFLFSVPGEHKIREGYTKWILRESMKNELPATVTWRKDKIGFEPPQMQWMKQHSLQERIHDAKQKLSAAGILKKDVLNISVRPRAAYDQENRDWRYLIAATLLHLP